MRAKRGISLWGRITPPPTGEPRLASEAPWAIFLAAKSHSKQTRGGPAPRSPKSRHRRVDPALQFALRAGAGLHRHLLAVLEHHQGRDRADAELGGHLGVLVDVELGDLELALHL